ncbi:MAG: hypothetical protein AB7N80_11610 [Bdellovibrionales bacterium]
MTTWNKMLLTCSLMLVGTQGHSQSQHMQFEAPTSKMTAYKANEVPNLIPLDQRWPEDEWMMQCQEFREVLDDALEHARNTLNNSKTLDQAGYKAAGDILHTALLALAQDSAHPERRMHPVAKSLARLALTVDRALAQNVRENEDLYHTQRYQNFESMVIFTSAQIEKFDMQVYGDLAHQNQFDYRKVELAFLTFVSELVQKVLLQETQLTYPGADGAKRSVPLGSYSTFFTLVHTITAYGSRELTHNLYGAANACAVRDLRQAHAYASRWLQNNSAGIPQHDRNIYEKTVEAVDKIKAFSTKPECQFYRDNRWNYPAKLALSTPTSTSLALAKGETR